MKLPLPSLVCATLGALLPALLLADAVEKLPTLAVTSSAGTRSTEPSVIRLPEAGTATTDLADQARHTAGLTISDAGARGFGQIATLRGLGNTPFFSDSSAPVYLDDIPLASVFTFPTELYDLAGLAVYRGPQAATLFGRAGDAGVIQLVSASPGREASNRARLSAGNHGLLSAAATSQQALNAQTDLSAGLSLSQRDGYLYNNQLQQTVDDRESFSGRIRLRYRPAADWEISLHALGQQARDGAQPLVPLGGSYDTVSRGQEGFTDTDFAAVALGITRQLPTGMVSATTSYSDWQLSPYANRLVVFGGLDFDSELAQSQRTFTEELRFRHGQYSGGALYSTARTQGEVNRLFSGFPIERSAYTTDADQAALFGRTDFAVAPAWTLTPGLRLESTAKDFVRTQTIPSSTVLRRDNEWSAFLPSLAASHRLNETSDVTLSLARGFKPGGYSAYTGRADLAEFGAQRTWTLEAAYSHTPRDSVFTTTVRAYASRVRGYQIERSFAVPGSFSDEYLVVNAERARVLGGEVEAVWRAGHDVTVTLAASLSHATLASFTDPFTGDNYSGRQAPYVPSGMGSLRVDYRPATGFFAGAGATWTGTTYYDEQESEFFAQHAYTLLEADAGYAFARGELRFFGRNLTDEDYYSAITPGVGHGTPGAPFTWGAELSLRW